MAYSLLWVLFYCVYMCVCYFFYFKCHITKVIFRKGFFERGMWLCSTAWEMWDLSSLIDQTAPVAVKVCSPNHCTAREFLKRRQLLYTLSLEAENKIPIIYMIIYLGLFSRFLILFYLFIWSLTNTSLLSNWLSTWEWITQCI